MSGSEPTFLVVDVVTYVAGLGGYPFYLFYFFDSAAAAQPIEKINKNDGAYAPGGTRTPDPGLIRPMLYQTELPELCCPRSGSNQGPSDLQSDALPTELHGRTLAETLSCASIFFSHRRHNKNKSTMTAPANLVVVGSSPTVGVLFSFLFDKTAQKIG